MSKTPRFTGIYHLFSTRKHCYVRIAVDCPDSIHPVYLLWRIFTPLLIGMSVKPMI